MSDSRHLPPDEENAVEPIDVVCPALSGTSPVQLDRFLFSLALQSYPFLYITIAVDTDAVRAAERAAAKYDWSALPRPPIFVAHRGGPHDEHQRRAFAIAHATRRFAGVVDVRGTLYTRAFELLVKAMRQSRAAIVYGDAIIKDIRAFPTFLYEEKRHYLGAWSSGVLQLRAGWLPPLAACLLDRDRIARSDLDVVSKHEAGDEALVFRLFSRYPARPIEERVPLYASDRFDFVADPTMGPVSSRRLRRGPTDRLVLALRELRRKMTGSPADWLKR